MIKIASRNATKNWVPSLGIAEDFGPHQVGFVYFVDIFFGTEHAWGFHFWMCPMLPFHIYAKFFCHPVTLEEFLKFGARILMAGDATMALRLGDKCQRASTRLLTKKASRLFTRPQGYCPRILSTKKSTQIELMSIFGREFSKKVNSSHRPATKSSGRVKLH